MLTSYIPPGVLNTGIVTDGHSDMSDMANMIGRDGYMG